nr:oligosaccharide repeat unit polymerase [Rhodococcus qingshengii]
MEQLAAVTKPAPLVGTIAAIALTVLVPMSLIGITPEPGSNAWMLTLMVTTVAGLRLAWVTASAVRRPFELMFSLFFYIFLGLAPLVQLRVQRDPSTTKWLVHSFDFTAIMIILVGLIATIIGSHFAGLKPAQIINSRFLRERVSDRRVPLFSVTLLLFALAYIAIIGPDTLFSNRTVLTKMRSEVFGDSIVAIIAAAVVSMGLLVSFLAQVQLRRQRRSRGVKAPQLLMVLTLLVLLICVNPVTSPRFVCGTVYLALAAGLGVFASIRRFRIACVVAPLALLYVFPLADAFRGQDEAAQQGGVVNSLINGDFDSFGQIVNTANLVSVEGFQFGQQGLGALLFWVPRSVWPNKPVDTGILLAEFRGYWFTNLSAPIVAEFFIDGGWVLLVIGMFLLGWWMRRWDGLTELTIEKFGSPPIIAAILPFYMLLVLRGSLLQAMSYLAVILGSAFFLREKESSGENRLKKKPGNRPGLVGNGSSGRILGSNHKRSTRDPAGYGRLADRTANVGLSSQQDSRSGGDRSSQDSGLARN